MSMDDRHISNWGEAFDAGVPRCGGKGWNLARLARYGFNAPDGAVLTVEAYDDILSRSEIRARVQALTSIGAGNAFSETAVRQLESLRFAIESAQLSRQVREQLEHSLPSRLSPAPHWR